MKNIKKILIIVSTLLIALFVSGCGKSNLLDEVNKNMSKVKSGELDVMTKITVKAKGSEITMPLDMQMRFYGKNKLRAKMSMSMMGQKMEADSYIVKKGDEVTTYAMDSQTKVWKKQVTKAEKAQTLDTKTYTSIIKSAKESKELKEKSTENTKVYEAKLSKEDVEKLMSNSNTNNLDFKVINGIKMTYEIDTKTKYIKNIFMDMTDALEVKSNGQKLDTGLTMNIKFKNLNKVKDFEIPKEALNAK